MSAAWLARLNEVERQVRELRERVDVLERTPVPLEEQTPKRGPGRPRKDAARA